MENLSHHNFDSNSSQSVAIDSPDEGMYFIKTNGVVYTVCVPVCMCVCCVLNRSMYSIPSVALVVSLRSSVAVCGRPTLHLTADLTFIRPVISKAARGLEEGLGELILK